MEPFPTPTRLPLNWPLLAPGAGAEQADVAKTTDIATTPNRPYGKEVLGFAMFLSRYFTCLAYAARLAQRYFRAVFRPVWQVATAGPRALRHGPSSIVG
jgi:hypothetical protein